MIDDIRLMNLSNDRYTGFLVSLKQIIKKIYEINPNYSIKYYDDFTSKNDILVAYYEEKICIHKYLTKCNTNPQSPGLADFLRGTISLFNLSKTYNYKLLIDGNHEIFKYLKSNNTIITNNNETNNTLELLPPLSYEKIYNSLTQLFQKKQSFTILTNSFYKDSNTQNLVNFGNINNECKKFMRDILQPSEELISKIYYLFESIYYLNINTQFKVIHLRCGDTFLHDKIFNNDIYNLYYKKINDIILYNSKIKFILLSDSSEIANQLKKDIPNIYYWYNSKILLGDLKNYSEQAVFDTMVDFFIMTKSNEIISINSSGFSKIISLIYDIKYTAI